MLHSVIMAGGSGTRFWPLSRRAVPKQFLTLYGDRSLIQSAYDRCQPWIPAARTWVITNERLTAQTNSHLPSVPVHQILQEPCGRNTAPCIGLAAICLLANDPDAIMLVMPSDHVIDEPDMFKKDVDEAIRLVEQDRERLVLFGVPPSYPATGFGYIERGERLGETSYRVESFREKPDRDTAEEYIRAGTFYWNCGIFVWRAQRVLDALQTHEPSIAATLEQLRGAWGTAKWNSALAEIFPSMRSISIDYAVLEREKNIAVVEARFPWDDVGSWEAMSRIVSDDEQQNHATGRYIALNSLGCIIHTTPDHLVAAIGMEQCIIVHTPNATLVADRGDEESLRKLVSWLEKRGLTEFL